MSRKGYLISRVTIEDPYLKNAIDKETKYLLSIDAEKMLVGFRKNAGLSTNGIAKYKGWETGLIAGHTMGHYLSALSNLFFAKHTGVENRDAVEARLLYLTDELYKCQQHSQGKKGFLFGASLLGNTNVEFQFDNVEKGDTDIFKTAWVPWYTMHKLLNGICDVYESTGYKIARKLMKELGEWVADRALGWDEATRAVVLKTEYGGMNDVMYRVAVLTGDERMAEAAHVFDETELFEKVKNGGHSVLSGLHANTTIPKFIGALARYRYLNGEMINGDGEEKIYLEYAKIFFKTVTERYSYATGGNSEWEHFREEGLLDAQRTNCNCETCNTYNMLKLARSLYEVTECSEYMDYYERTFKNAILGSQNPETGMTTYFQPMASGYFKVYSTPTENFWCCTGTGMENFSKLGTGVYSEKGDVLYVDMYLNSTVYVRNDLNIKQSASLTNSSTASFIFRIPDIGEAMTLAFRIPSWAEDGKLEMKINKKNINFKVRDGYAYVRRVWMDSDVLELAFPVHVKTAGLPDRKDVFALTCGPLVYVADLGYDKDTQITDTTGVEVTIPTRNDDFSDVLNITCDESVEEFLSNIEKHVEREVGDGKLKLKDVDREFEFIPYYQTGDNRFGMYWYLKEKTE